MEASAMPRGFNENEKEIIRNKLMVAGRDLFSSLGLKKTSIKDLTGKAGIAQGTFYHFFESKEIIYFLLLEQDEKEIQQNVILQLSKSKGITAAVFANALYTTIKQIEKYPLIQRLFTTEEYEVLVRKLPIDVLTEHGERDLLSFSPLVDQWKREGKVDINTPNDVITSVLRAYFLMTIHKREIGEEIYDQSLQFLAEGIALRMFKGGDPT